MKKLLIRSLSVLFLLSLMAGARAQKLKVTETKMPLTKKANKFSTYGGTFWNQDQSNLHTFYLYTEKKTSPMKFQEIPFSVTGKLGKPVEAEYTPKNLTQYNLEVDESITEPNKFTSFDKDIVWFKHGVIGLNAVAYEGKFESQYSSRFFPGYEFEKTSDRILLMGEENQSLNMAFVESTGESIDKFSNQMKASRIEQWGSMAYIPKGETAIVGGLMNGRVKIGLDASEDWLRYRFMVGRYNTSTMSFDSQEFYEYDYSMTMITWLKTEDANAVLFGMYPKGIIENNRAKFPDTQLQKMMLLVFDKKGNKVSENIIDVDPKVQLPQKTLAVDNGAAGLTYLDGAYYLNMHTAEVNRGTGPMENINIVKIKDGQVHYNKLISMDEFDSKLVTPKSEKIKKYNKRGTSVQVETFTKTPTNDLMIIGKLLFANAEKLILHLDDETGELKHSYLTEYFYAKKAVTVPIGERGWATTKAAVDKDPTYYDFQTSYQFIDDHTMYLMFRTQTGDIRMGATRSRTSSSSYATYYKTVSISEYYTFGKLFKINLKDGTMSEPVMIDDEVTVGLDPLFISEDGTAFIHGYDGKNYKITTVK
ncbi:MAG: hypothetical protein RIC03_03990 [Cyclobacteriaceae bacterium]